MNAIMIVLIIDTALQLTLCKFSLWYIITLCARVMFMARMFGIAFKIKTCMIIEAVAWCSMLLFHFLFHKGNLPWMHILLYLLFGGIACLLMFLDDFLYVYVTQDDTED